MPSAAGSSRNAGVAPASEIEAAATPSSSFRETPTTAAVLADRGQRVGHDATGLTHQGNFLRTLDHGHVGPSRMLARPDESLLRRPLTLLHSRAAEPVGTDHSLARLLSWRTQRRAGRHPLQAAAPPRTRSRAAGAQAYMKSAMPSARRPGAGGAKDRQGRRRRRCRSPPPTNCGHRAGTLCADGDLAGRTLRGDRPHRAAAGARTDLGMLPVYEEIIRTGAWWDFVDGVANGSAPAAAGTPGD